MPELHVIHDKILVKPDEKKATEHGIIIPDTVEDSSMVGTVVEVGPGKRNKEGVIEALQVKRGDRIVFAPWGGNIIELDNVKHLLMTEKDILGILTR